MIPNIAIQGHPIRGKEIIQILESLGGKSRGDLTGRRCCQYYFINSNGDIDLHYRSNLSTYKLYTLEEFEKEFPFKVGDKVITDNSCIGVIEELVPNYISPYCVRTNEFRYWCDTSSLKLYKEMKEERNITLTLDKAKEWYKKGGELKEIALQAFTEKELAKVDLPKTWEEFCGNYPIKEGESYAGDSSEIYTHCKSNGERDSELDRNMCPTPKSAEAHLALIQLEQLRDCYRQGDIPDFNDDNTKKYCIIKIKNDIYVKTSYNTNSFLSFTKKEVAEEFLTNFKPLIKIAEDYI